MIVAAQSIGNEITHPIDVSWNQTWTGTKQKRIAMSMPGNPYPDMVQACQWKSQAAAPLT